MNPNTMIATQGSTLGAGRSVSSGNQQQFVPNPVHTGVTKDTASTPGYFRLLIPGLSARYILRAMRSTLAEFDLIPWVVKRTGEETKIIREVASHIGYAPPPPSFDQKNEYTLPEGWEYHPDMDKALEITKSYGKSAAENFLRKLHHSHSNLRRTREAIAYDIGYEHKSASIERRTGNIYLDEEAVNHKPEEGLLGVLEQAQGFQQEPEKLKKITSVIDKLKEYESFNGFDLGSQIDSSGKAGEGVKSTNLYT